LDVRGVFNAAGTTEATSVYASGVNALTSGLSGEKGITSLASLSTEAAASMEHDPMFNIFKYALYTAEDFDVTAGEDFTYADDFVREAITTGNDNQLAVKAALILNVMMVITHKLYSAVTIDRQ
jgi:hypothetical protein